MPKTWDKRDDGYIWYQGLYRSQESVDNIIKKDKLYKKQNREKRKQYFKDHYKENNTYENEKDYYKTKSIRNQKERNPFYGFSAAESQFRAGSISPCEFFSELDRRVERAKELLSKARNGNEGTSGDV
jgi:cyclopropane fatty-acyl-phospholipid synthase-like methyltransferase